MEEMCLLKLVLLNVTSSARKFTIKCMGFICTRRCLFEFSGAWWSSPFFQIYVSFAVSGQEAGSRQMLHIMCQSTDSKNALQMRILMRGNVCGSSNSLIMLSQLLCVCVCKCAFKFGSEHTNQPNSEGLLVIIFLHFPHLSFATNLGGQLNALGTQYGVVLSHQRAGCQTSPFSLLSSWSYSTLKFLRSQDSFCVLFLMARRIIRKTDIWAKCKWVYYKEKQCVKHKPQNKHQYRMSVSFCFTTVHAAVER